MVKAQCYSAQKLVEVEEIVLERSRSSTADKCIVKPIDTHMDHHLAFLHCSTYCHTIAQEMYYTANTQYVGMAALFVPITACKGVLHQLLVRHVEEELGQAKVPLNMRQDI